MNKFWNQYSSIQSDLDEVTEIIKKNIKSSEKTMEEALLGLVNSRGKQLRPAFLLLTSGFGNGDKKKILSLAAVIEMLHMATLIHDDIIDDSELRRNRATIQFKYGKEYAVFMGDFLFCRCFMILSNESSMENMKLLSKAISKICMGEINQFSSRHSKDVSVKKYLKRIGAKTAALFSLSFYVGAEESGCSEKLYKQLGRIGYEIGMAFQIIDDILDYTGSENVVGKPLGSDLKEGVYTLPIIYALQRDKSQLEYYLNKDQIAEDEIKDIINITKNLGGIDEAKKLAKRYTDRALNRILKLPKCKSKDILLDVTKKLLEREY